MHVAELARSGDLNSGEFSYARLGPHDAEFSGRKQNSVRLGSPRTVQVGLVPGLLLPLRFLPFHLSLDPTVLDSLFSPSGRRLAERLESLVDRQGGDRTPP